MSASGAGVNFVHVKCCAPRQAQPVIKHHYHCRRQQHHHPWLSLHAVFPATLSPAFVIKDLTLNPLRIVSSASSSPVYVCLQILTLLHPVLVLASDAGRLIVRVATPCPLGISLTFLNIHPLFMTTFGHHCALVNSKRCLLKGLFATRYLEL